MTALEPGSPTITLVGLHARLHVLQTIRVPFVLVSITAFPVMGFLFFALPQGGIGETAVATASTAQFALFSMTSVCLFSFGAGVAEERLLPWDASLRVLPAGSGARLAGRLLSGLAIALLGLVPLFVTAVLTTTASVPVGRWVPAAAALLTATAPLLALGLTIGYLLPARAAVAAAQLLLLPLAFAGGLFFPPEQFPGWLDSLSHFLPTRAGRDIVIPVATGGTPHVESVFVLVGWLLVLGATAIWAYHRDEGERYR